MDSLKSPIRTLILVFTAFKAVLLSIVCASPGLGYDTSTHLMNTDIATNSHLPDKFVRWDAIYYVSIASHGYVYEQQWAFGWGFTKLISFVASSFPLSFLGHSREAWAGILVANISHLLSVLALYRLTKLLQSRVEENQMLPFIAALLHILAPAGVFLSAPYGESLFSLLNFAGTFAYCMSRKSMSRDELPSMLESLWLVGSGAFFGLAATVRSNSIFNGLIFAYDLVTALPRLPQLLLTFPGLRYLISLVSAGLLLAVGFVTPQTIAYLQYCTSNNDSIRVWCTRMPPSIYSFVQAHYWNVGFFRYWTPSNIPLFILAMPMLAILSYTGLEVLLPARFKNQHESFTPASNLATDCLQRIAMPQLLLTILALTTFHIQVITRVASGYPLPYFWLASTILKYSAQPHARNKSKVSQITVRFMILYALIQCSLFASFLPPA